MKFSEAQGHPILKAAVIKERRFHEYLAKRKISAFAPIEMAKAMKVSNRTIINWCAALCKVGLLEPEMSGSRIRSYRVC